MTGHALSRRDAKYPDVSLASTLQAAVQQVSEEYSCFVCLSASSSFSSSSYQRINGRHVLQVANDHSAAISAVRGPWSQLIVPAVTTLMVSENLYGVHGDHAVSTRSLCTLAEGILFSCLIKNMCPNSEIYGPKSRIFV